MRGFAMGLSVSVAFILGCAAGASPYGMRRTQAAVVDRRWSYFCFDANTVDDVNFKANAAGMRGWELIASSTNSNAQSVWCFRQPRP